MTRRPIHKRKSTRYKLGLTDGRKWDAKSSLSELEEIFIEAAEFGDFPTIKSILREQEKGQQPFSVDYTDIVGRTPLQLAVANEHLEVVELLLGHSNISNIHEALLHAISKGHEHIAESILKHPKYIELKPKNKRIGETDHFFNQTKEDSPFSSDITPLILAAERNQIEIVQLLLLRGETIKKPHHYYCNCQECSNKLEFDELRLAKTRLNAYKGLASCTYISLTSEDPVLTAFDLAKELRYVSTIEKSFKTEYLGLADQLSDYVVKLLDKVRGHDELEKLINKKRRDPTDESYALLARLQMAIQCNEKKFVAHPSCQQKLVSIWYDDFRIIERSHWMVRIFIVLGISMMFPFLSVFYWLAPSTKAGKWIEIPCIRFIGHTTSFLMFLTLILISTLAEGASDTNKLSFFLPIHEKYSWYKNQSSQALPSDFAIRTYSPDIVTFLLSLWIVGMLLQEMKQVYSEGITNYFDSLYNYMDVSVLTLYLTSFTLKYLSIMKTRMALTYFESTSSWQELLYGSQDAGKQLYWIIADRFYWDSLDPHNVADGMFAMANVISFCRVTHVLHAYELFGPMQISLTKMIGDILKFAVIFLVVFVAFLVGLHNLYWYYPKETRQFIEFIPNNITTSAEKAFGFPTTFHTVFWSLFSLGEPTAVELGAFNHYFTQNVGYWIFGAYNIATVIVLLNMLIAMMSRSFEKIQEEADTEWKFARSKIYMEFIKNSNELPVPFNIFPTPRSMCRLFASCCCKKEETGATQAFDDDIEDARPPGPPQKQGLAPKLTNGYMRNDSNRALQDAGKLTYKKVMKRIVKRFVFDMERDVENRDGELDELKQDISSFRYEILNQLQQKKRHIKFVEVKVQKLETKMDFLIQQQRKVLQKMNPDVLEDLPEEPEPITPSRRSKLFDSSYWSIDSTSSADEHYAGSEIMENENESTAGDISKIDENSTD
uniref:Short transient receptor potential channel 3-like n=1 Tax=Crassostrea virginica TaxID=6565 RepID=A0A8B8DK52_CRAVI|nr:short transient receptor potential channel 3-like [Crassostrea virginica]XP_022328100.1 short transient receptor potential channel 3-like [Crassostrea virginica]